MDRKSHQGTKLKWWLIGWGGTGLINLIGSTLRIRLMGFENARAELSSGKVVLAFWHSRILLISYLYKGLGAAVLVSSSKDGEIVAQILRRQGHQPIRGSTSRHGVRGLARLIRTIREKGCPAALTPDGPRGPRFRVQPGVISISQKTGYPIIPISYSARSIKIFSSWDRFILPYPFTEASVICGKPISIPAQLNTGVEESYRIRVEEELNRITHAADGYYGHRIG